MKHLFTLFSVVFVLGSINVNAQNVWSLQKCIDYALENNIQIKQQKLNTDYYENQVSQAKSDRLPNLNASASNNYGFGRSLNVQNTYDDKNSVQLSGGISSGVTLFNGFILQNTIEQKQLDLKANMEDLQKAKDDITLNVAASYLEILFAQEIVLVSQSQTEVTQQQINRTKQLVDAGSLARGALLEIQAQLAREELQLVNDQNREQLAYLTLYQLLELPISESFKIAEPVLPEVKANVTMANSLDVFNNAMAVRPEIIAAQLRVESANRQLEIVKGSRYPSLSFGASYNNQYYKILKSDFDQLSFGKQMKSNGRYGVGLNLNIPIFNRFQIKNNISNSTIQIYNYQYQLQSASNLLRKDIEQAYTNSLAALNLYISSEKAVVSMEEAFRYIEEKFNVGMVNTVDYNLQKNQLTAAKSQLLQAKYEYIFRTKILDFYNGIPIEL